MKLCVKSLCKKPLGVCFWKIWKVKASKFYLCPFWWKHGFNYCRKEVHLYPLYGSQRIQAKTVFLCSKKISQNVDRLYHAIKRAFSDKNTKTLLKNVVFFSSDGTTADSSFNAGMIETFKEFTIYTRNLLGNWEDSRYYINKFCLKCTNLATIT